MMKVTLYLRQGAFTDVVVLESEEFDRKAKEHKLDEPDMHSRVALVVAEAGPSDESQVL